MSNKIKLIEENINICNKLLEDSISYRKTKEYLKLDSYEKKIIQKQEYYLNKTIQYYINRKNYIQKNQ